MKSLGLYLNKLCHNLLSIIVMMYWSPLNLRSPMPRPLLLPVAPPYNSHFWGFSVAQVGVGHFNPQLCQLTGALELIWSY